MVSGVLSIRVVSFERDEKMGASETQRIFDLLGKIQEDTAMLLANRATDLSEINRLRDQVQTLQSWKDQMVGRVAIISIVSSFIFGAVGAWISSLWRK